MKWFKKLFARWSREAWEDAQKANSSVLQCGTVSEDSPDSPPKMRFSIREAINGRVIEIATYSPQPRGSDWKHELYIVPDGKKVSESLALLMLMKGMDS
jgi:hypothetical protein